MDHYLAFLLGLAGLVFSADQFVRGSASVAKIYRISPVLIGAVLLGFGTSLPESLVSITAAATGDLDIAAGNIIGSNVANLGLVMAYAVMITQVKVSKTVFSQEGVMTLCATVALTIVLAGGSIGRGEGALLLIGGILVLVRILSNSGDQEKLSESTQDFQKSTEILRVVVGLIGTVVGAFFTVRGAAGLAESWGITGGFVGFLLIAIGTSLPELVTTAACARRGEMELIVGNLFGSNIFNCLLVGGLMGVVGPGEISSPSITGWGLFFMVLVTVTLLGLTRKGEPIQKSGGVLLLAIYLIAAVFLGMNSSI
jgi:cation:H+ antiporter